MDTPKSFLELFDPITFDGNNDGTEEYGISIPMIQRDYVQGGESQKDIRGIFLDDLFDVLTEKKENLELDFIYGSIQKQKEDDKLSYHFIPLDGQQRLTTLYLLYWYIGRRELDKEELAKLNSKLNKFLFETRISSTNFCNWISELDLSFTENPKIEITHYAGFFRSYKQDPTVTAMLEMLDAIHKKYQSCEEKDKGKLYANLNNIKFYLLDLGKFELNDELYIKMNARGKPLTDFEKFKADLENHMNECNKDSDSNYEYYNASVVYDGNELDWKTYFSIKLDTTYTNFFWKYCQNGINADERVVDPWFLRFFRRHFLNIYSINDKIAANSLQRDEVFKALYGLSGDDREVLYQNFKYFQPIITQANVLKTADKILTCLNLYYKKDIKPQMQLPWIDIKDWDFFGNGVNTGITQLQRVLLLGLTLFIEKIDFEPVDTNIFTLPCFRRWMRIVRNLAENANINSVESMVGTMRRISELSNSLKDANNYDILNFIVNISDVTGAVKEQLQEEVKKAKLIIGNKDFEAEIIKAENHIYFRGQIYVLLYISEDNIETFKVYRDKAMCIFAKDIWKFPCTFHRALFALVLESPVDGYDYYSADYGSNRLKFYKDDEEIRYYMIRYHEDGDFWYKLIKLLLDSIPSPEGALEFLEKAIKKIKFDENKWQTFFITSPYCFNYCEEKLVRFESTEKIYLLKHSKMSHKHSELRTYYLYKEWIYKEYEKNKSVFAPFKICDYWSSPKSDEKPCAYLDDLKIGEYSYAIDILYSSAGYQLQFFSRQEEGNTKIKLNEINNKASLGMEYKKGRMFSRKYLNMEDVKEGIMKVCLSLNKVFR
jgi:hypothetical protein